MLPLTALLAGSALAATPVSLSEHPASHGASIALGDLFEGAPASAAGQWIGRAQPAGQQTVLDAARVQAAARGAGLDWDNPQGLRRIVVAAEAGGAPVPRAGRAAKRARQALAYARNLNAGERIGASDLIWSDEAVAPADAPGDAERVIGQAARRPLRAGAAVALHDLAAAKVIKRDDMVAVAFESEGVSLTLTGKAMADAAVGEAVPVMNLQSKKPVQAIASGPGQAVVGPAADSLKVAAFTTALR